MPEAEKYSVTDQRAEHHIGRNDGRYDAGGSEAVQGKHGILATPVSKGLWQDHWDG